MSDRHAGVRSHRARSRAVAVARTAGREAAFGRLAALILAGCAAAEALLLLAGRLPLPGR